MIIVYTFFFGMVLVTISYTMLCTSLHSSSGTLSTRYNPLNLFSTVWITGTLIEFCIVYKKTNKIL